MFRLKYEIDENGNWVKHFLGRPIDSYIPVYDRFFAAYELKKILADDKYHRARLKRKQDRVCRFCGRKNGETKFKSAAHLVPSLLGNKHLFSDFECVPCNFKFSGYESQLANFLGISLSLVSDFEKDRIRKLKNPAKDLIIKAGQLPTGDPSTKLVIESHNDNKGHFKIDESGKELTINFERQPYIPYQVYLAFLKIAVSCLNDDDTKNYSAAVSLLTGEKIAETANNHLFKVPRYFHPGPQFPSPLILLFEKKDLLARMPTHQAVLLFKNYSCQITIPYGAQDKWLYNGETGIEFLVAPPFIDYHWGKALGEPSIELLDLTSQEHRHNHIQPMVFSFDQAIFPQQDP